jgi:MFS family permease
MPARQAIIADLVGEKRLVNAITLNSVGLNSGRILGPAIAGVLAAAAGIGSVYALTAALYVFVVWAIVRISYHPAPVKPSPASPAQDLLEGWKYTYRHPILFGQMLIACAICVFGLPYITLMPVFAKDIFGGGVTDLGVLTSSSAVGFLFGSIGLALAGDFSRKSLALLSSVIIFGIAVLSFALSSHFLLSCILLGLVGISNSLCLVLNQTIIQTSVEPAVRGRVLALFMTTWGLQSLGSFPIGALAQASGAPLTMAGSGFLLVLSGLLIAFLMPRMRKS